MGGTTDSSSAITGAFTVGGGVGIAKSLYVGGTSTIFGGVGLFRTATNVSDYTMLGTNIVNDATNTRIVISGNTRTSFSGAIHYIATNTTGWHEWFLNNATSAMNLDASGNLTLNGGNCNISTSVTTNCFSVTCSNVNQTVGLSMTNNLGNFWQIGMSGGTPAGVYSASGASGMGFYNGTNGSLPLYITSSNVVVASTQMNINRLMGTNQCLTANDTLYLGNNLEQATFSLINL